MASGEDYVDVLRQVIELSIPKLREAQDEVKKHGRTITRELSHMDGWFAHIAGFLYRITGEVRYAELARDALLLADVHGGFTPMWAARAYRFITAGEVIDPQHLEVMRQALVRTAEAQNEIRWGQPPQWNGPLIRAVGNLYIAKLFPDNPRAKSWAATSDKIVGDWLKVGDVAEDAINYEPLVLIYIIAYAELTDREEEIFFDRNFRATVERYLTLVPPIGIMPDYGDSSWGVQWGLWIAAFEKLAGVYGDGRYKWVADRYFNFARDRKLWENFDTIQKLWFDFNSLVCAYEWLSEEIEPQKPDIGSKVTYRTLFKVNFSPKLKPLYDVEWAERREDKLIFRTGWDPEDAYLCVNIQGRVGHDHSDAGAIITYIDGGAVLLHDCSYIMRHHEFHNLLYVQDEEVPFARPSWPHSGERFNYKPQMKYFVKLPRMILSGIESRNYFGYPITHMRSILFDKKRGPVVVHDRALIHEGEYELGPIYHVAEVMGRGSNYFCTEQGKLWHHHGISFSEKPARLVIAFPLGIGKLGRFRQEPPPHPFRSLLASEIYSFNNNICVYQSAKVKEGDHVNFLTILAPQGSEEAPDMFAQGLEVLNEGAESSCVRYRKGEASVIVGFRGDGPVSSEPVTTDAAAFHMEISGEETVISFHEATHLQIKGEEIFRTLDWPEKLKQDKSRYFRIPSALSGELKLRKDGISGVFYSYEYLEPGIPVAEIEVGFPMDHGPRRLTVDGQKIEPAFDDQEKLFKLTVRGKTFFEWAH